METSKEEKNIAVFILQNRQVFIGDHKDEFIHDALEIVLQQQQNQMLTMCMPIGVPFNKKPQTLELSKINILFKIEDDAMVKSLSKVYEDTMFKIDNPNIKIPKGNIIH